MTNIQIADALDQIADLLEFQNANPFRIRAYRNSARSVRDLAEPVDAILADPDRKLIDIDGIGKDLALKITTLSETGTVDILKELLAEIPESVLAMLRIPGLGPKKAAVMFNELKIKTLQQLEKACKENRVRELKGFGAKTEEMILKGLSIASEAEKRIYWATADEIAQSLLVHMRACPSVNQAEMAGSYRRGRETVGDLDVLVDSTDHETVMDCFNRFNDIEDVIARGKTKMSVRLVGGLQIDLRVVETKSFGAALQYFTGSKDHNVVLRGLAKSRGLKINEYGVFRVGVSPDKDNKYLVGKTEEEIYASLDLPCFEPELREARSEFDWAKADQLPDLIELADLRGDLHMHTEASDGTASLEEMVEAAKLRGLKYIAITDHSKRVTIANGLDAKRLRKQWAQIDKLNEKLKGFRVLKGVECDILENGDMDLTDDVLAEADWVMASVHFGHRQPRDQITERILGAIRHPSVSAISHPTGRIINRREPYDVDLDAVIKAAAEHGKFLELNAHSKRLDLTDVACAAAKKHGVKIVINSDAHRTSAFEMLRYGILQARRGGLTKQDVANTLTWPQLKKLIGRKSS